MARFWGKFLARFWLNFGSILVRFWLNFGAVVEGRFWIVLGLNCGVVLGAMFESVLGPNFGATFGSVWASFWECFLLGFQVGFGIGFGRLGVVFGPIVESVWDRLNTALGVDFLSRSQILPGKKKQQVKR